MAVVEVTCFEEQPITAYTDFGTLLSKALVVVVIIKESVAVLVSQMNDSAELSLNKKATREP